MVGVSSGHESEPDWTIPMTSALDCLIGASLVSLATSLSTSDSGFWSPFSLCAAVVLGQYSQKPWFWF